MADFEGCKGYLNGLDGCYINIPFNIAKFKAVPLTGGKKLLADSPQKDIQKFLTDYIAKEQVHLKLQALLFYASLLGKGYPYLTPTESGHFSFHVANFGMMNRIGKVDEHEQVAVIYDIPNTTDSGTYTRTTITPTYIDIETFSNQEIVSNGVTTPALETKLMTSQRIETGLNFMPFFEYNNLPYPSVFSNSNMNWNPDWWEARGIITDVQQAYKTKRRERILNITRFNLQWTQEMMQDAITNGWDSAIAEILEAGGLINIKSNDIADKVMGANFGIVQGDPKLEMYTNDIVLTTKLAYNECGYDYSTYDDSNYTNKTQTIMLTEREQITTQLKQEYLLSKLYNIFNFLLKAEGLWDGESDIKYTLRITPLHTIDRIMQAQEHKQYREMRTISRAQIISERENIPLNQAKEKLREIDKENEEFMTLEDKSVVAKSDWLAKLGATEEGLNKDKQEVSKVVGEAENGD